MKKKHAVILVLMSVLFLLPSTTFAQSSNRGQTTQERIEAETRRDEIKLINQRKSTRSVSEIEVEASFDGKGDLEIFVTGFHGTAYVQVVGGRTSLQGSFDVYEMGYEVFGIGSIRAGSYTLRVILGTEEFEGTFEKATVGR